MDDVTLFDQLPPRSARALQWLSKLATGYPMSQMPDADRLDSYVTHLEERADAMTAASLADALRTFKWFPSIAELWEFTAEWMPASRPDKPRLVYERPAPVEEEPRIVTPEMWTEWFGNLQPREPERGKGWTSAAACLTLNDLSPEERERLRIP